MPVLRNGVTADAYQTPDIYIEEQVLQIAEQPAGVSSKVLGILGQFQRGSLNEVFSVVGETQFKEKLGDFLDAYPGSKAAWTALKRGVKKLILVNVRGAGATAASITLMDRAATPVATLEITKRDANAFGNECSVEVAAGTAANTFKLILSGPGLKTEIYDNLASPASAAAAINSLSKEFEAEDLESATVAPNNNPAVLAATKLTGGSDGSAPTATQYKGSTDGTTGKKTGLELMKTSIEVTDVVTDFYVSDIMNGHMVTAAEAKNWFTYLPLATATSVSSAVTARASYDTDFAHLTLGHFRSKQKGWLVPGAVYDAIAHVLTPPQDGTAGFTFADIEAGDVQLTDDDIETLTRNNIVCLAPMLDAQRNIVYGLKSDYTTSTNPMLRQTYRRRLTSLFETDVYIILTPYRSKHISTALLDKVEVVLRSYLDRLQGNPQDPDSELIQGYSISFTPPEQAGSIDEFISDLTIDLYNIADKIRVRLLSAADVA